MEMRIKTAPLVFVLALLNPLSGHAQTSFDSGSDGSDGALNITSSIMFDNVNFPSLDSNNDGVYHFTTINIADGAVVSFSKTFFEGRPVIWLASGDVIINGELNLDGDPGHDDSDTALIAEAKAGPGGFNGGLGYQAGNPNTRGKGPGGSGAVSTEGCGAGYLFAGSGRVASCRGASYGNIHLLPLLGGSGAAGGGGSGLYGGGGGAGGGALLVASSSFITLNGLIHADGGDGGGNPSHSGDGGGGGGSGGAVRLMAPMINGSGRLSAAGGRASSGGRYGSVGYLKLESYSSNFTGSSASPVYQSTPGLVSLSTERLPLKIVSIAGLAVPDSPTGYFFPADVSIDSAAPATIEIVGKGVPLDTVVKVVLVTDAGQTLSVESSPLSGELNASTASAVVTVPHGLSHIYIEASWD